MQKALHILAGVAWTVGAFFGWGLLFSGIASAVQWLASEGVRFSASFLKIYVLVFSIVTFVGFVVIPPVVALKAIRGYLPGTGRRGSTLRGFAVEPSRTSAVL